MNDELEPEVLSYREFKNRETLRAWEQRRRAIESQPGRWREALSSDGDPARGNIAAPSRPARGEQPAP